jgi:hypothetical protein
MNAQPAAAPVPPTTRELAADISRRHRGLLRELWIEVGEAGAVLHGRAYSFYGKQLALHEVRRRGGVVVVANRIAVDL